jgi:tetratricopeptide (TPR) repeat protein
MPSLPLWPAPASSRHAILAGVFLFGVFVPSGAELPTAGDVEARWEDQMAAGLSAEKEKEWHAALEHYRAALGLSEQIPARDFRRLDTLEALAQLHYRRLKSDRRALPYLEEAAEIRLATGATLGTGARETWGSLQRIYYSHLAWKKAAWAGRYELRCQELRWGEDSPRLIWDLTLLAWQIDHARPGDPEAEELILRAVALADTPQKRGRTYTSAGDYYLRHERYEEANDYITAAIVAYEHTPVPQLQELVSLYGYLGEAYAGAGQTELAETSFLTALSLQEEWYGARHPKLVHPLYRLGKFLVEAGQPGEALPHLERAVALADAAWGPGSVGYLRETHRAALAALGRPVPEPATVSKWIDCCCGPGLAPEIEELLQNGELEAAEEFARSLVATRQAEHGAVSREAADALGELGLVLHDSGEAADVFERQFEIVWQLDETSPRELAWIAERVAWSSASIGDFERAERFRLIQIESLRVSPAQALLAEAWKYLGELRLELGRPEEAFHDFRLAAETWIALTGGMPPEAFKARGRMAWALIRAGRFREAEELLIQDLDALEDPARLTQESTGALERVLYALMRLYETTDRDGEAQAMEERRRALMALD